tara:strand:+ start:1075 stop:1257 length:183 start_codon:yes stop_codon:yes gene_type:complete
LHAETYQRGRHFLAYVFECWPQEPGHHLEERQLGLDFSNSADGLVPQVAMVSLARLPSRC